MERQEYERFKKFYEANKRQEYERFKKFYEANKRHCKAYVDLTIEDFELLLSTIEAQQQEIEQLKTIIATYQVEAEKIPAICNMFDGWSCQAYQNENCPAICRLWEDEINCPKQSVSLKKGE